MKEFLLIEAGLMKGFRLNGIWIGGAILCELEAGLMKELLPKRKL